MHPIIASLYKKEELTTSILHHKKNLEKYEKIENFNAVAYECFDIGCLYEIKGNKNLSQEYYQKAINCTKKARKMSNATYINALLILGKIDDALDVILENPHECSLFLLAVVYENLGRKPEAQLIYSDISYFYYRLSSGYHLLWQPHYIQAGSDYCLKAQLVDRAKIYNQKAVEAWEEMKNSVKENLPIEKAWLFEEIGYIYENADRLIDAMRYYQDAQKQYESAYTDKFTDSTEVNYLDGDWSIYNELFPSQIPDYRLIYFRADGYKKNDFRRIKYRILNLEEKMKSQ